MLEKPAAMAPRSEEPAQGTNLHAFGKPKVDVRRELVNSSLCLGNNPNCFKNLVAVLAQNVVSEGGREREGRERKGGEGEKGRGGEGRGGEGEKGRGGREREGRGGKGKGGREREKRGGEGGEGGPRQLPLQSPGLKMVNALPLSARLPWVHRTLGSKRKASPLSLVFENPGIHAAEEKHV